MKIIKKINILVVLFVISGFFQIFFAGQVFSQANPTMEIPNPLEAQTFEGLVKSIATWFYRIMIPVASIVILYAAFLFLTSAGDEEKIKKAKRAITWAIVGIAIIIIGAGFITLIKSLLNAT